MIFRQGDPQWDHLTLGYGPATIGEAGCLLTVNAQMLRHYGFSVSPLTLNQILKDAGRWVNGDLLSDAAVSGLPQFQGVKFVTKWDFTNRPADLSVLTNNATDEYTIELDFDHNPNDGIQTHFVRFVSYLNGVLLIDDPEYGEEVEFTKRYGNDLVTTILKIVKYTGPTAPTAPAPAPVEVPTNYAGAFEPLTGSAHVIAPANVRTGPGTGFPVNDAHTAGGKLAVGETFAVSGLVVGEDPYSDGRNKWYRSQYGNFVWEGNLTVSVQAANGGGSAEQAAPAEAPAEQPAAPAEDPSLHMLGYNAWLKPALNNETQEHEGAPIIDLATKEPVAIFPIDARAAFVAFRGVDGLNYFVTQHMLDNNLNYGINGLNMQQAEQPGTVIDGVQAAAIPAEEAKADTETAVQTDLAGFGPIWHKLFGFLEKHHPDNK